MMHQCPYFCITKPLCYCLIVAATFCSFAKPQHRTTRKGKDYALFFAVNQYKSPNFPTLQNPIDDAKNIAEILRTSYGFETKVVENPTYDVIENTLKEYSRNFTSGRFDTEGELLIFFSGHGARQLTNGYFLPSDARPDDLKRSAFNYKIWRDDIDAMPCKHILVAIDACYSGTFDPKFGMRGDGLFGTRSGELSDGQRLIAEHNKHKTRLFFTSGETDQPTPDKSDFAKKFKAALLTNGYDDGILTSSEMFSNHLEKAAPRPRTGEFGSDEAGASFVFIAETTPLGAGGTEGVTNTQRELDAWDAAQRQNTLYAYENFLRLYPNTDFKRQAQAKLQNLKREAEIREWQRIRDSKDVRDFENFKTTYPNSSYAVLAEEAINALKKPDRLPFEPEMVSVQGGTFQMGDVMGDNEDDNEKPIHSVTLSSFYMGKYEVTQAQWQAVMDTNPSGFKGDNLPVEKVSWEDVKEYLKKLNAQTGKNYRLPTEAEWEYAAREGGKKVRFGNGKDIANPAEINFDCREDYKQTYSVVGVYRVKTTPVGSFSANSLGLYDISGNVCEWCSDWYSDYSNGAVSNPTGAFTGSDRVLRGGGWYFFLDCRVANRGSCAPKDSYYYLGFRVVLSFQ